MILFYFLRANFKSYGWNPCTYSAFISYWIRLFPHVKIRQYKGVCGKCETCACLGSLRKSVKGAHAQGMITELVGDHRKGYMSQRVAYYEKRLLAASQPHLYGSIIFGESLFASNIYFDLLIRCHSHFYINANFHIFCKTGCVDRMAQIHCMLQWLGNKNDFGIHLPQHLQGCLQHARSINIYR